MRDVHHTPIVRIYIFIFANKNVLLFDVRENECELSIAIDSILCKYFCEWPLRRCDCWHCYVCTPLCNATTQQNNNKIMQWINLLTLFRYFPHYIHDSILKAINLNCGKELLNVCIKASYYIMSNPLGNKHFTISNRFLGLRKLSEESCSCVIPFYEVRLKFDLT